jgi:hypothetical protein
VQRVLKVPKAGGSHYGRAWTKILTGINSANLGKSAFLGPELPVGMRAEVPVGALLLGFAEDRTPSGHLRDIDLALWQVPDEIPLVEHSRWNIDQSRWWRWALLVERELIEALETDPVEALSDSDAMLASQLARLPAARRAAVISAATRRAGPGTGTGTGDRG